MTPGLAITNTDMVDEVNSLGESQIQQMFAGSSVFLTGGTGFLGKLLMEKLMRSCPDVKKIFMLARPKKNKNVTKRMQEQFDDLLYDRLRTERPDFIQKIVLVEGDISQIGLGMNEEDRVKIMTEVEFIFHLAATVRFDEPLKGAIEINVRGTKEVLQLAKACRKLKAIVHTSTAYSNCLLNTIEEKLYDSPLPGDKLIDLLETVDEETINNIAPRIIKGYPNTYAFTKAAAEDVVAKHSKGLPVAVFRPSIVLPTATEPIAGWIDNMYGPSGMAAGIGVGLLRVVHANPKVVVDLVPGDMVVKACIAVAWKTAKDFPRNHDDPLEPLPLVYNYVSSEQSPVTIGDFTTSAMKQGAAVPSTQAIYYNMVLMTPLTSLYKFYVFLLHWLPAFIIDGVLVLIGKKPVLRNVYTKISKFCDSYSYFLLNQWRFINWNTQNLFSELCDIDKRLFDFDMSKLDWEEYSHSYVRGIRVYIVKDPLDSLPSGIKKHRRLKYLHYFCCVVLGATILKLLWGVSTYLLI